MIEYKGYIAFITYDALIESFHASTINSGSYCIADAHAPDLESLKKEFAISIDMYIDWSEEDDFEPTPPSVKINIRWDWEDHLHMAMMAARSGMTVDDWIKDMLQRELDDIYVADTDDLDLPMLEYKGCIAPVEYDSLLQLFSAEIAQSGSYSLAPCRAPDIETLKKEFRISVNEYLALREQDGAEPPPPPSNGKINLHPDWEMQQRISAAEGCADLTIEDWIKTLLRLEPATL